MASSILPDRNTGGLQSYRREGAGGAPDEFEAPGDSAAAGVVFAGDDCEDGFGGVIEYTARAAGLEGKR